MDIENLKGKWKKYTADFQDKDLGDKDDLIKKIRKKSHQSLRKLRRNFFLEAGINILAVPILLIFFFSNLFQEDSSLRMVLLVVILVALAAFFAYLYVVYKRIYKLEDTGLPLQEKLSKQVNYLKTFIRYYYRITYGIYILVLAIAGLIDYVDNPAQPLIGLGVLVIIGVIMFFIVLRPITRFYTKKLYGKHLDSLEKYLNELK